MKKPFEDEGEPRDFMNIEIINTGTELMLGRVLNTHQQWLGAQLADLGCEITRQVAIADAGPCIEQVVREALSRADLIIVTGGLGPTADDLTRDLIARLLGAPLHEDPAIVRHLEQFFAVRGRPMPASTRVQALVPQGAMVLPNAHGTAPGLAIDVAPNALRTDGQPSLLILLPGPPRELRPMFSRQVVPLLKERLPRRETYVCRVLKAACLGESVIEEKIAGPLRPLVTAGLDLGYCARVGEVEVRLAARGSEAERQVNAAETIVRDLIGAALFGEGTDTLEAAVVRRLIQQHQTLATAESCTGGLMAHRLTNVPGASAVFRTGLITYSNEAKQRLLGVTSETLAQQGAVSEAAVREMAEGARLISGADYALAVTGIAGPTGGTPQKPVGTVYLGLASLSQTVVQHYLNPIDRETFKWLASQQALEMLRQALVPGH
jgi:nicotinamide-nucleotide amidase